MTDWGDRLEKAFLRSRAEVALILAFFVVLLVAFLVRALFWPPWFGFGLSDALDGLLTLGTLSLAWAALVTAVIASIKRRDDLTPHLDIQFCRIFQEGPFPNGPRRVEPLTHDLFPVRLPVDENLPFRIRNLGPGNAIGVSVRFQVWYFPDSIEPAARDPFEDSTTKATEPPGFCAVADELSLRANEDVEFALPIGSTQRDPVNSGKVVYRKFKAAIVAAWGEDVEGHLVRATPKGLRVVTPTSAPGDPKSGLPQELVLYYAKPPVARHVAQPLYAT